MAGLFSLKSVQSGLRNLSSHYNIINYKMKWGNKTKTKQTVLSFSQISSMRDAIKYHSTGSRHNSHSHAQTKHTPKSTSVAHTGTWCAKQQKP